MGRVWASCSGIFILYGITLVVRAFSSRRVAEIRQLAERHLFLPLFLTGILVLLTQLFNLVPIGMSQGPSWYLLGVTWLLFSAGYVFCFILRAWVRSA